MQLDIQSFGLWALTIIVGVLSFMIRRTLHNYDKTLTDLSNNIKELTDNFRGVVLEFQKEIGQIRMEAALIKQSSAEVSKYSDRFSQIEKSVVILESKVKAAFSILTGKRQVWTNEKEGD